MTVKMRFNIQGTWEENEVESVAEFKWEGMNFILHKNFADSPAFRVSHKETGMEVWAGDKAEQTRKIAVSLLEQAGKPAFAKSVLAEIYMTPIEWAAGNICGWVGASKSILNAILFQIRLKGVVVQDDLINLASIGIDIPVLIGNTPDDLELSLVLLSKEWGDYRLSRERKPVKVEAKG